MKLAPSPARKIAAAAISSTCAIRPSGLSASFARISGVIDSGARSGVSVGPGASALTRIAGANSRAQARVIDSTPPFEAQ